MADDAFGGAADARPLSSSGAAARHHQQVGAALLRQGQQRIGRATDDHFPLAVGMPLPRLQQGGCHTSNRGNWLAAAIAAAAARLAVSGACGSTPTMTRVRHSTEARGATSTLQGDCATT